MSNGSDYGVILDVRNCPETTVKKLSKIFCDFHYLNKYIIFNILYLFINNLHYQKKLHLLETETRKRAAYSRYFSETATVEVESS